MKKHLWKAIFLCLYIFLIGFVLDNNYILKKSQSFNLSQRMVANVSGFSTSDVEDINTTKAATNDKVSIGFVGDIIPGLNADKNLFNDITSYTNRPDIMIGNFEGAVSTNEYLKCPAGTSKCFSFRGDQNFLELVHGASFDILNIANNHFNDYGELGRREQ